MRSIGWFASFSSRFKVYGNIFVYFFYIGNKCINLLTSCLLHENEDFRKLVHNQVCEFATTEVNLSH